MDHENDKMGCSFNRLPLELVIMINQELADLPTLYKFICTSAKANAAFTLDASNALNKIIKRTIPDFERLACMICFLGSIDREKYLYDFESLVEKFQTLPTDVLTTAPPKLAFFQGTSGPRHLLLTAYRIEYLAYIFFATLLQNINERMFGISVDENTPPEELRESKSFRDGVHFRAAGWWYPTHFERYRIERAIWRLFVCWDIRASYRGEDLDFKEYDRRLCRMDEHLGPKPSPFCMERCELACVHHAVREFLNCEPSVFFLKLPAQERKAYVQKAWSKFEPNFRETGHWRSTDWRFTDRTRRYYLDPGTEQRSVHASSASSYGMSRYFWQTWDMHTADNAPSLEKHEIYFPDFFGLSLWDPMRLEYLGLKEISWFTSNFLGPPEQPNEYFSSHRVLDRWVLLFLYALHRRPGGGKRELSTNCKQRIRDWLKYMKSEIAYDEL